MITARQVCDLLGGKEVKPNDYLCKCPVHQDNTASLSVTQDGEKLLLNCFAGCSFQSIMQSLEASGLSNKGKTTAIKYDYLSEDGKYLYSKYKRKGGTPPYWLMRGKIKGMGDTQPVLYRLPEVIKSQMVYIVEGEKDVETLRLFGLVATCNFDGAGKKKWREEYNQYFIGKDVRILSDNDDVGMVHGKNIFMQLFPVAKSVVWVEGNKLGVGPKGDISDAIEGGMTLVMLEELFNDPNSSISEKEVVGNIIEKAHSEAGDESEGPRKAKYEDYVKLFTECLGTLRRDVFSGSLMYKDARFWKPAVNCEKMLRSEALQKSNGSMKYSPTQVTDHLGYLEHKSIPQLLFSIPEWDGVERIKVFAGALKAHPAQGFNAAMVQYLLTDWLVNALKRVSNPYHQNRILILQGDQGIGKDRFSDCLLCGAGQWYKPLSVVQGDKDTFLQPSKSMFLKISEFDKTSKMEVSLLKDLITTPTTDIRGSYDRSSEVRESRASFIAGCNVDDILRDHTGARRYMIIELLDLPAEFPIMDVGYSLQVFAEAKALGARGWARNLEHEKKLAEYLKEKTPDDPSDEILAVFASECADWAKTANEYEFQDYVRKGRVLGVVAMKIVVSTAKILGIKPRQVQTALAAKRLRVRTGSVRGYLVPNMVGSETASSEAVVEH